MKKFIQFLFIINSIISYSQSAPTMEWQKVVMTDADDRLNDIIQTSDEGYITLGATNTSIGYSSHCSIRKIDKSGNLVWSKTIGGSGSEFGKKIIKLMDGNFFIMGTTSSTDGDMGGHSSNQKMFVFKMDDSGNFIWKKFYVGDGSSDILPVADGYVLLGSVTNSGFYDIRVHKISLNGDLMWTKTYGGSADDNSVRIALTPDNNFIIFAQTRSNNGNVTNNHGQQDIWILKLDSVGNLLSQKTYGGSNWDYATDFIKEADGYVLWGQTSSSDGDLTGVSDDIDNHDYWLLKINFNGQIIWQKKVGSDYAEYYNWGKIIKSVDNNYIALGLVWNGTKTVSGSNFHGGSDIWLVKFDTLGNILWKRCWGGSSYDYALNFIQNNDGSIVVAGSTNSQNGDLSGSGKDNGREDTWVFKLFPENNLSTNDHNADHNINVFPNPTSSFVYIETDSQIENIDVLSINGQLLKKNKENKIDFTSFPKGIYFLKIETQQGVKIQKIIKE